MDCFLLTLGTHGDVELFRLLGRELLRRGHRVTLGASPFYRQRIEATGLGFLAIGLGTPLEMRQLFRSLANVEDKRARVRAYAERWVRPQLSHSLAEVKVELSRTDYFINNLRSVWRSAGRIVPGAAVTYDPVGDIANIKKYAAQLSGYDSAILELVALPRALVDPDEEWGPRFQFSGFWRDPDASTWQPTPELTDFIANGAPPIAITMGSMLSFEPAAFLETVFGALKEAGQRGILVGGWSEAPAREQQGDGVLFSQSVPYEWLFPQCALVIHHGGSGTVASALRAGKPSIVLPQISSQEHFAKLLARQGVLAGEFNVQTWNAESLAEAMRRGVDNHSLAQCAAEWAERLASERGLERAAHWIEAHAAR